MKMIFIIGVSVLWEVIMTDTLNELRGKVTDFSEYLSKNNNRDIQSNIQYIANEFFNKMKKLHNK